MEKNSLFPNSVSWMINHQCNYKCQFCYPDDTPSRRFTDEKIDKSLKSIATAEPDDIYISGGEPFLAPHFKDCIKGSRKIAKKDLGVMTNGSMITEEILSFCKDNGVTTFGLSLEHSDAKMADQLCGIPGCYEKKIKSIELIKKFGFNLRVVTVLLKQNAASLDNLIDLLKIYKVDTFEIKRFRPVGKGKAFENEFGFNKKENLQELKSLYQLIQKRKEIKIAVHDPLFYTIAYDNLITSESLSPEEAHEKLYEIYGRIMGCLAGRVWIGIDPEGNVSPCPLLLYTGMKIGNIYKADLREIITSSPELKWLEECKKNQTACKYGLVCGGCKTHSAIVNSDYLSKDPLCWHDNYKCPAAIKKSADK